MAIEVIESGLTDSDEMIQRFPEYGTGEIKWGAQLTVTDGEWGVFFRDGKALEVFDSGRHVLTTQNIPVLTKFVTQFGYGPDSPFRSNVSGKSAVKSALSGKVIAIRSASESSVATP